MVKSLVVTGIIGGVGGVLVFLPQIVILFGFIVLMCGQPPPNHDRNDRGEYNRILKGARIERGVGLDHADQKRTDRGQWIRDEAADHRTHETFQPDQEAGVVIDRGYRTDGREAEGRLRGRRQGRGRTQPVLGTTRTRRLRPDQGRQPGYGTTLPELNAALLSERRDHL